MTIVLFDDGLIGTFESPESPPNSLEWIDVENQEYQFCSDTGQPYRGQLVRREGLFQAEQWRLVPTGLSKLENVLALIHSASGVDPDQTPFPDLDALRQHVERLHA